MKIYDCFTFRDELDVLELRLKILDKVVDKFVICEANKTFTNISKPYHYLDNIERFKKWEDKIIYLPIELEDEGLDFTTYDSSYNPNSPAWQFEYQQRSALIYGLEGVLPDDLILMGDLDEIPNPKDIIPYDKPTTFEMDFFYYYCNNKSIGPRDASWLGTTLINGEYLSTLKSLQQLRDLKNNFQNKIKSGWHLSYLGGKEMIQTKITSFSHTEFNQEKYWGDENVEDCLQTGKDVFNRPGMNFKVQYIEEIYPYEIIDIIIQYPKFIFNDEY